MNDETDPVPHPASSPPGKTDIAGRRRALRRLLAGGSVAGAVAALPSRWTQPVVRSVLLPAHAQTSPAEDDDPVPPGSFVPATPEFASASTWLGWLVASARADSHLEPCSYVDRCARLEDGQVTMFLLLSLGEGAGRGTGDRCYTGTAEIGGTVTPSQADGREPDLPCALLPVTIDAVKGEAADRTLVISVDGEQTSLEEIPGDCDCGALSDPA